MNILKQFDNVNFRSDVLGSATPVLVAFTAYWCEECQELLPLLKSVAGECRKEVIPGAVDVEENHDLACQFNVERFPSVILFMSGEEVSRFEGKQDRTFLTDWINTHLQCAVENE
jgi:thioredoxin 1